MSTRHSAHYGIPPATLCLFRLFCLETVLGYSDSIANWIPLSMTELTQDADKDYSSFTSGGNSYREPGSRVESVVYVQA